MKNQIINEISSVIKEVAKFENEFLMANNRGIFDVKEHAFVYLVGKAIMNKKQQIFGTKNITWENEKTVVNDDNEKIERIDLAFEVKKELKVVIEFKMDNNKHEYLSDVLKLSEVPSDYTRLFCSCKYVYKNQCESFKEALIERFGNKAELISSECFDTFYNSNKNDAYCLLTIWEIK